MRASAARLIASISVPSKAFLQSAMAASTDFTSESDSLSRFSRRTFSVEYTRESARFRASISSRFRLSSSACESASRTILLMSSLDKPLEEVIVILFLTGAEIFSRHVHDAVCVDIECHFDLRNTAWGRRNPNQMEFAEGPVVARHRAFTLQHVDFDLRLVVRRSRKDFALACRN